jgi:hypothetical protein
MHRRTVSAIAAALLALGLPAAGGGAGRNAGNTGRPADPIGAELERGFGARVRPFLQSHCTGCHGGDKPKGQLDLGAYQDARAVAEGARQWEVVLDALVSGEMPPDEAKPQPSDELRGQVVDWIKAFRAHQAARSAGDPGPVLAHRLSNAEYDYTIRDLTGVDIRPTREFPVDPANEAGFDNSGESLAMSPALLKKYLEAAHAVAERLVLKPEGFAFAPDPVVAPTDRDKYAVARIIDFYARQPTDLAGYFAAAWRHRHRAALGRPDATLADAAAAEQVSAKYLATVWAALTDSTPDADEIGPLAETRAAFRALPPPPPGLRAGEAAPPPPRAACEALRDRVMAAREKLSAKVKNLQLKAVGAGSQPFILWKNTQYATHRRSLNRGALYVLEEERARREGLAAALAALELGLGAAGVPAPDTRLYVKAFVPPDPALAIPAGAAARARYEAAFARFCDVFPDAFYVSERGRVHLDRPKERADKGRLLSAGGHNMMGYFRDDLPLSQLILDREGQRQLDMLWRELYFITLEPTRTWADYIFYERAEGPRTIKTPEFDFIRSEDKRSATDPMIRRLAKVYLAKAKASLAEFGGDAIAIPVLEEFFVRSSANIRRMERDRLQAEPGHLRALAAFAARAYRRPLTAGERAGLVAFYRGLRAQGKLDHEEAMRDALVSVLMSSAFLYRALPAAAGRAAVAATVPGVKPLDDHALASRLSYFLWSSVPDQELLARAAAGDLRKPQVLVAQARRMLKDGRARALAVEFGGSWLDYRRFEEHNGVDRARFPSFDNELRRAMAEEPVRFFMDVVEQDRSVLDFVYGRHTFVNAPLARHYGMPPVTGGQGNGADVDAWVRVDDADRYGRGGVLPMAVFLTRNSPGLRTSPVKRGYWVVRRALGERIPPPPAQVPDLPNDEAKMGNLTLREALARHRRDPACAACHARFDSFGLAFEGFGPIGERRRKDLGGRAVDTRVEFPGGGSGDGLEGLRAYVREHRQDDFVDNLCRKLLSYALGRSLMLSDDATVAAMKQRLAADGHRFGGLVDTIVQSPQFLNKRSGTEIAQGGP